MNTHKSIVLIPTLKPDVTANATSGLKYMPPNWLGLPSLGPNDTDALVAPFKYTLQALSHAHRPDMFATEASCTKKYERYSAQPGGIVVDPTQFALLPAPQLPWKKREAPVSPVGVKVGLVSAPPAKR